MIHGKKILFCLRYGIGDVVMELPALRGLRRTYPESEIHLLGALPALELFEGDPDFQALISVHDFGFEHWGDPGDEANREEFERWFCSQHFEAILDPFHAVYGIQQTLTGSGVPWYNSAPKPPLAGHPQSGQGITAIWRAAAEIWKLDTSRQPGPPAPGLHVPDEAWEQAKEHLGPWQGLSDPGPIGIAPIASSPLKRWPLDRVVDTVEWLTRDARERVLIFGMDHNEDEFRRALGARAAGDRLKTVAPVHLQVTAALAASCRAFLSNDTGLMHLAAAVGTRTVGIFGPTAAHIYQPPDSVAVASDRPCGYRLQETFGPPQCVHAARCLIAHESCINTVSVDQVKEKVEQLLASSWEDREGMPTRPLLSDP